MTTKRITISVIALIISMLMILSACTGGKPPTESDSNVIDLSNEPTVSAIG